jgi:adenine-specific DNA-methyltransferase
MDEVFGAGNFVSLVTVAKTTGAGSPAIGTNVLASINDYLLWYSRNLRTTKYRQIYDERAFGAEGATQYRLLESPAGLVRAMSDREEAEPEQIPEGWRIIAHDNFTSQTGVETTQQFIDWEGRNFLPNKGGWKTNEDGSRRLARGTRLLAVGNTLRYRRRFDDFGNIPINNLWTGFRTSGFADKKTYVVQTNPGIIERAILMTTDPGDLVLDPTCGSGTTASVAEQWGRRWITIDTSRVALALARARIMGARYPYYILADSPEGLRKEAEVSGRAWVDKPTYRNVRQGFVYERVPHVTLKSIANNAEIDVIWENWQPKVKGALDRLNAALRGHDKPFRVTTGGREGKQVCFDASEGATFMMPSGEVVPAHALVEWEVLREAPADWPAAARVPFEEFWAARIGRQKEIDASIAAHADTEYLFDRPYEDKGTVRVAGPFTVESLSPHRVLAVNWDDSLIDGEPGGRAADTGQGFVRMILDNLKAAGVQQAHKEDRIVFSSLAPWPGRLICAEGRYDEGAGAGQKRAAIFIGPEFGTVTRPDLVEAAREASDAGFDVLIACAFNYDAHSTEFSKLGRIPVLKARMNADLHMAAELKSTGKGNLFVIFGEPDIDILDADEGMIQVQVKGIDIFKPQEGKVEKSEPDELACWFIDTDYNEESFFVRHAYFLGANDPYKSLKTSLKAEINHDAWETLHSDTSRPFPKPASGRIAVKVINHLGDEVMKVFKVT